MANTAENTTERITVYDIMRKRYVVRPDAPQGENIQRLGLYEDRDEVKAPVYTPQQVPQCVVCGYIIPGDYYFCPWCGQRLKEVKEE